MAGQRRDAFTAARSLGATPTATLTSISQQPLPRTHPGLNRAISHKGESALPLERTFGCSEGNEVTVVDAARVRLGIPICYELEIPEYSAALADRGAVNDEEVAVARLELGGHCSRSIPARSNRAVTSRSGRPHGPADQPVSQTVG